MELKELTNEICKIFDCETVDELPTKIMDSLFKPNVFSYYDKYIGLCKDLEVDYLQKVFQFFHADRENKKQDYTPIMLARLLGIITVCENEETVYDSCAGSGALTIQKWVVNNKLKFICEELDENVIPILLFNLSVRNIEAKVINKNVLTGEGIRSYSLSKGLKYSSINKNLFLESDGSKADASISNPPFNLKVDVSDDIKKMLPSKYTCNWAFVANCISRSNRYSAIILPNNVLTSEEEKECRKYFIEKCVLKAVISMPNNMFESTSIPTCVLLFDNKKNDKSVVFVNAEDMKTVEVREQRGEGNAYNRIYKKDISTFTNEQLFAIYELTEKEQQPYSVKASYEKLVENDYRLNVKLYIKPKYEGSKSRDFNDIIIDINRVISDRNILKLNVNKVWAERLGLVEIVNLCESSNEISKQLNESLKLIENYKIENKINDNKYIQLSNNKVFQIENIDKEKLSSILTMFISMYKQHIYYLNEEENRYLIELRDALLPELMNGNLKI